MAQMYLVYKAKYIGDNIISQMLLKPMICRKYLNFFFFSCIQEKKKTSTRNILKNFLNKLRLDPRSHSPRQPRISKERETPETNRLAETNRLTETNSWVDISFPGHRNSRESFAYSLFFFF
jgi:hypothetical protein